MRRSRGLSIEEFLSDACIPEPMSGCWLWLMGVDRYGYGRLKYKGRMRLAHRAVFEHFHGEQPPYLVVRHRCDNTYCVNPDHLCLGTHQDNMSDMVSRHRARTSGHGSRNHRAKLNEDAVQLMRQEYGEPSDIVRFARRFGVSPSTVSSAVHTRTWKHV